MPYGKMYRCERCDKIFSYSLLNSRRWYLLPNGHQVRVSPTPGWCRKCKRITACEDVPLLETLEKHLEDSRARSSLEDHAKERAIEHYRDLIDWRQLRNSLPRCLYCEGTDVHFPKDDVFVHQGCGGLLTLDPHFGRVHISAVWQEGEHLYDPDGNHLRFVPDHPPPPTDYRKLAFRLLFVFLLIGAIVLLCRYVWG